jgi:malate dehydrogenase (oxaloacetate-decarboxylating)
LEEVVRQVRPTILLGTSGQSGAFTEDVVRTMAAQTERPLIMPLSNPTSLAEATPRDLIRWTGGRALAAAGSPFPPVTYDKTTYVIAQANNSLVFPGLGLGVTAARASRVTDSMLLAAASAIRGLVDPSIPGAPLLPLVDDLRHTSLSVAVAVARAARESGVARTELPDDPTKVIAEGMWRPRYRTITAI